MLIGTTELSQKNHTYIMGILNVTPDSFSDGGQYNQIDHALFHAEQMLKDGAAILDVGGESTRPGYTMISDEEEIERVCPVIEAIRSQFSAPISIDTYKSKVASAAIQAGADMVNDIWGLKYDSSMVQVVSEAKVTYCLMHNRDNTDYNSFLEDYITDMKASLEIALNGQIEPSRIILDPGIGFAKTTEQNILVLKELQQLKKLGYPVLIGASNKSVIGNTLSLPVGERLEGTLAITAWSVMNHAEFVRVHDVKANQRVIQMLEAIMKES